MIAKFLEVFFRHKLLILLPSVVIPLFVAPIAVLTAQPYYEAGAGIWVERPAYFQVREDVDRFTTPAQIQSNRVNELLRSRTFLADVAGRTSLAPLLQSSQGEDKLQRIFEKDLAIAPGSNHLVTIRFRSDTREQAVEVPSALIDAYKEKTATDRTAQASTAISFYEDRLKAAEEQLQKTEGALRRYTAANPRLRDALRSSGTASSQDMSPAALDPQYAELMRRVQMDGQDVERARTSSDQARLDASAGIEGLELGLQVIDPPVVLKGPTRELRKVLIFPVAGVLVGIGLSATLLLLLVAADRSVRSEADLATTARVVGIIPRLQADRASRRIGADAARRAVGIPAGSAVPVLPEPSNA